AYANPARPQDQPHPRRLVDVLLQEGISRELRRAQPRQCACAAPPSSRCAATMMKATFFGGGVQIENTKSVLVVGATGRTGQHFVSMALNEGHRVRALVRTPEKLVTQSSNLELHRGSISEPGSLDKLLDGIDFVISMLGDAKLQQASAINT